MRHQAVIGLLNGESYRSAHVSLNLLNELGKRDKMRLAEHFIAFRDVFNTFINT